MSQYYLKIKRELGSPISPTKYRWTLNGPDGKTQVYAWYGVSKWAIRLTAKRIARRIEQGKSDTSSYTITVRRNGPRTTD